MKLVFFEPHHTGGDAKIVITSEKAIEYQKKRRDYPSDEEAFLDFISIHWALEEKEDKMSHHGEHVFDVPKVNLEAEEELTKEDKQFLEKLKNNHSEQRKCMFSEFVLMCDEIKSMGIDPVQLWRVWSMRC